MGIYPLLKVSLAVFSQQTDFPTISPGVFVATKPPANSLVYFGCQPINVKKDVTLATEHSKNWLEYESTVFVSEMERTVRIVQVNWAIERTRVT